MFQPLLLNETLVVPQYRNGVLLIFANTWHYRRPLGLTDVRLVPHTGMLTYRYSNNLGSRGSRRGGLQPFLLLLTSLFTAHAFLAGGCSFADLPALALSKIRGHLSGEELKVLCVVNREFRDAFYVLVHTLMCKEVEELPSRGITPFTEVTKLTFNKLTGRLELIEYELNEYSCVSKPRTIRLPTQLQKIRTVPRPHPHYWAHVQICHVTSDVRRRRRRTRTRKRRENSYVLPCPAQMCGSSTSWIMHM